MKPQIVAYIPARGGSKGILRKNIRLIGGRPLVHWVLSAAEGCNLIDSICVGTDDQEIARVVEGFKSAKTRVVARSAASVTDQASSESALQEFARNEEFDWLVFIQATSPLLTAEDLTAGIERVLSGQADSVVSVVRQRRFIWNETVDGGIAPANYDPRARPRRQDWNGFMVENGAFYITSRAALLQTGCRISGRIVGQEMREMSYWEIDEMSDWQMLDVILHQRPQKSPRGRIKVVLTDVDGVLTDAGMYYSKDGDIIKKFNARDGKGFEILRSAGVLTGIVTGEKHPAVETRAMKLRVDLLAQGVGDKVSTVERWLSERGLHWGEIAYIGDDWNDLEVLKRAGISSCPSDALEAVRKAAGHVCTLPGGHGCFREFVEYLTCTGLLYSGIA